MRPDPPFNPLEIPNVALALALEVLEQPVHPLPPESFTGPGVYLLYYHGDFSPYGAVKAANTGVSSPRIPIYIGKSERSGKRKGTTFVPSQKKETFGRLRQHADSIRLAENLELTDFTCRYRVIEDTFIGLAEMILVSLYRPVWNVVLEGFGNNPTGKPRENQKVSPWDLFHPGRLRGIGSSSTTEDQLRAKVLSHLESPPSSTDDSSMELIRDRIRRYSHEATSFPTIPDPKPPGDP